MDSYKQHIKKFLQGKPYTAGGIIEDFMRSDTGAKGETTSRVLRMMAKDGTLENDYFPREKGRPYVVYRIRTGQLNLL